MCRTVADSKQVNGGDLRCWQIGKLMKAGQAAEATSQKKEVESANEVAAAAEEELNQVISSGPL